VGAEPINKGQILDLWHCGGGALPTPWDHAWDCPDSLKPVGLRQLSPFYREEGRRRSWRGQHNLSITVIADGFYKPVMGPESSQPYVLLSQFGDLLMGEEGGVRC
jgi:hypothetical protein